jgi:hypothetical protein
MYSTIKIDHSVQFDEVSDVACATVLPRGWPAIPVHADG